MIVCIPHAKVGYRQAICKQGPRARKECRGFLFTAAILSFYLTIAVLARLSAVRMTIQPQARLRRASSVRQLSDIGKRVIGQWQVGVPGPIHRPNGGLARWQSAP